jgi:hypothetical protein
MVPYAPQGSSVSVGSSTSASQPDAMMKQMSGMMQTIMHRIDEQTEEMKRDREDNRRVLEETRRTLEDTNTRLQTLERRAHGTQVYILYYVFFNCARLFYKYTTNYTLLITQAEQPRRTTGVTRRREPDEAAQSTAPPRQVPRTGQMTAAPQGSERRRAQLLDAAAPTDRRPANEPASTQDVAGQQASIDDIRRRREATHFSKSKQPMRHPSSKK